MFQKILVPLDGSTASFDALDLALRLAVNDRAELTVLCVIDNRVSHEAQVYVPLQNAITVSDEMPFSKAALLYQAWAQQVITEAEVRSQAAGIKIHPKIVSDIPHRTIISACPQHDLLVMGIWDSFSAYPGPFLAGTALWHVVAQTRLPVICAFTQPHQLQRILVAYDDSPAARDVLQLAATLTQVWGLKLTVLTVQQSGGQAQQFLHQARVRAAPTFPRLIARDGDPTNAILTIAEQHKCDLIALGVHARRSLRGYSLGNVTDTLLRSGQLPLLLSH